MLQTDAHGAVQAVAAALPGNAQTCVDAMYMSIRSAQKLHEHIRNENGDIRPELMQIESVLLEARKKMPEAIQLLRDYLKATDPDSSDETNRGEDAVSRETRGESASGEGDSVQVRRMQKQLYEEISRNYQNIVVRIALCTSLAGLREAASLRFAEKLDISFNVWSFYNDEKNRKLLFQLNEAAVFGRIYGKFSRIGNDAQPGYAQTRAKEALAEIDDRLLDGGLDKHPYKEASSPEAWQFIEDLLNGKRESHRRHLNPL
jgi:hypothetical protein